MFTEKEILDKFGGDEEKAIMFMELFIEDQKIKLEEAKKINDPDFIKRLIEKTCKS
jgi:hypothetical protein